MRNNLTAAEQPSHCNDIQVRCSSKHPPLGLSNPDQPNTARTILAAMGAFYLNSQTQHSNCTSLFIIQACSLQQGSFSLQRVFSVSKACKPNLLVTASYNLAATSYNDFQETLGFPQYNQHITNCFAVDVELHLSRFWKSPTFAREMA